MMCVHFVSFTGITVHHSVTTITFFSSVSGTNLRLLQQYIKRTIRTSTVLLPPFICHKGSTVTRPPWSIIHSSIVTIFSPRSRLSLFCCNKIYQKQCCEMSVHFWVSPASLPIHYRKRSPRRHRSEPRSLGFLPFYISGCCEVFISSRDHRHKYIEWIQSAKRFPSYSL